MGKLRLKFWLAAIGIADALRAPLSLYLWLVRRASDATDWGCIPESIENPPW